MSNNQDSTQQTVREMAKLSMLSNKINEIQEKNLKIYPFVFFNGVSAADISYDFSNNLDVSSEENRDSVDIGYKIGIPDIKNLKISYYLTIDLNCDNSHIEKRNEAIENSVRNLLWNQISVEVYFNNVLQYKSK